MCRGFASRHPGGGNFLFLDGSMHWLQNSIDTAVYRAFGTIDGGEQIPSNAY